MADFAKGVRLLNLFRARRPASLPSSVRPARRGVRRWRTRAARCVRDVTEGKTPGSLRPPWAAAGFQSRSGSGDVHVVTCISVKQEVNLQPRHMPRHLVRMHHFAALDPAVKAGIRPVSYQGRKSVYPEIARKWRFFAGFALPKASTFDTIRGAASGVTPFYFAPYSLGAT